VPGIVGLGEACKLVTQELVGDALRLNRLTQMLASGIKQALPALVVNGPQEGRLPGNWNISIPGIGAEAMMLGMRDLAISSGAACASANMGPSHVLKAMGLADERCHGSLRFGLGRFTADEDIQEAIKMVRAAWLNLGTSNLK
jgi:cysteine desulfurase